MNFLRELPDLKSAYHILARQDRLQAFSQFLKSLQEHLQNSHRLLLRDDLPKILKDPRYIDYTEYLLHHLREYDIITDSELAYYIGEFNIKNIEREMRSKLDLRRMKNVNDVRHVGGMGGGVDLGDVGCFYNPVQSMINMKTEYGGVRGG
jgi:hypothetical protein